jgi:hypothetical protein
MTRIVCPGCGQTNELDEWQCEDGPCRDGQWYCAGCITQNRCGCARAGHDPSSEATRSRIRDVTEPGKAIMIVGVPHIPKQRGSGSR